MKTENLKQAKGFMLFIVWMLAIVITSCGGGQKSEAKKKLEETRQLTIQNLNKMKIDLEDRISYIDKELETAVGDIKVKLEAARTELNAQKDALVSELEAVKDATLETWNDVVKKASETIAKVNSKKNEVSKSVREMLDAKK